MVGALAVLILGFLRFLYFFHRRREEGVDFVLDCVDFAEGDLRVFDDVDVAGLAVLVDAEQAGGGLLGVGFDEEFFAFEHHGEDVAHVFGVRFVFLDEALEEGLGVFLVDDFDLLFDVAGFEDRAPEGEWGFGVVVAFVPGFL